MSFQCSSGNASHGNKSLRATGSINNDEIAARYRQPCRGFLKHIKDLLAKESSQKQLKDEVMSIEHDIMQ
ncbi:hypothetical protein NC651_026632 [Populus alba x Populus x berolinensis]|nr:hypothetical protein NC651_026632 [Populus alba x Populus x berolinensis]